MSHELDFTTGEAAIAYRNAVPWHGFGEKITENMNLEEMMTAARLFNIQEVPALYSFNGALQEAPNRKMLIRDDTGDYLNMVSENRYEVRQPREIVEFFRDLCDYGGFQIETLGALFGGGKVWCLASRKGEAALDIGKGTTKPYLLLAESYLGDMATTARFTTVEVVCNNTLRMSAKDKDTEVRVRHNKKFDADSVKDDLGHIDQVFADYMAKLETFKNLGMSPEFKAKFFFKLFGSLSPEAKKDKQPLFLHTGEKDKGWEKAKAVPNYEAMTTHSKNTVEELLRLSQAGNAPGSEVATESLFNALQTTTYFVDHLARGKGESRWQSALMGQGDARKVEALALAEMLVA